MTNKEPVSSRTSILRRFNIALVILYFLSTLISAPIIYFYTQRQTVQQANAELELLVDMVTAIKSYVAKDLRPYFLEKGLFHTPGFSGIVATARIADNFKQKQDHYVIRSVSDNPLNPKNMPYPLEFQLLDRFRKDKALSGVKEVGLLGGERMLVASAPMKSKQGCLTCHGDPATAPSQIVDAYGQERGYFYKVGDTVGLSVIGVPLADVNALAIERSLLALGFLTLLFGVILVSVNMLVRRNLISPILEITHIANDVAKGRIDQPIDMPRNDEIGDLARSVELLRRSFAQLMKRARARM